MEKELFQFEEFFYGMRQQREFQCVYGKKSKRYAVQDLGRCLSAKWGMTGQDRSVNKFVQARPSATFHVRGSDCFCRVGSTHGDEFVPMMHAAYQGRKKYHVSAYGRHYAIATAIERRLPFSIPEAVL
ncbi:MAG: hypothetical protein P0119_05365 [Nitrospira sp.]|nr:hypothetical protein [Nitrospira sp.]